MKVGEKVSFDGSASFDDVDPPEKLKYKWDFDRDGKYDKNGRQLRHAYKLSGTYEATLKVIDSDDLSDKDKVKIKVRPAGRCAGVAGARPRGGDRLDAGTERAAGGGGAGEPAPRRQR